MSAPPPFPQTLTDAIQMISLRLGSGSLPTDWVGPLLHLLAAATESDVESALEPIRFAKADVVDWRLRILMRIMRWALDDVFLSFCRHGHEQAQDLEPLLGPALRVLTRAIVNRVRVSVSRMVELHGPALHTTILYGHFQSELYDTIDWNVQSIVGLECTSFAASLGPTMLPILTEFHFHLLSEFAQMRPTIFHAHAFQHLKSPMVQSRYGRDPIAANTGLLFELEAYGNGVSPVILRFDLVDSVVAVELDKHSKLLDFSRLSTCVFMSFLLVLFSRLNCSDTNETLHIVYPLRWLSSATFLSSLGTYLDCLLDPSSLPSISRIYRRVSQNLLSLLHATAMMALEPSTPYWFHASDDQSPAARRRFASSVGSLVTSWLRRAQADPSLSAQFFAIDARIASESDMFYTSLCEGLAEYVVYDLLDGAEVAALIDAELLFMPLVLPSDDSDTAFWRARNVSITERIHVALATAFADTKDRAAFVRRNEDVIISTLLRLAAEYSGSLPTPDSNADEDETKAMRAVFAIRATVLLARFFSAAGIDTLKVNLPLQTLPFPKGLSDLSQLLVRSFHGSIYHMKRAPVDLLANLSYSPIFVATEVGNLLQVVYVDPLLSGLLSPEDFAKVLRFNVFLETEHYVSAMLPGVEGGNQGTYLSVSSLKYGAMVAIVSRVLRLLKRYPEAFCGLTVQSNLATFVLYFGRFLREAEGEGLEQLEKSRKRLLQLSLDVRKAGSDRARARKAMEEKTSWSKYVAGLGRALDSVHLARRLLHWVGQQLRAAVAARLELEALDY